MSFTNVFGHANIIGGTVATPIVPDASTRELLRIANVGAATIYLGGAAVTPSDGYPLTAGAELVTYGPGAIYGIVASGTIDVRYFYTA